MRVLTVALLAAVLLAGCGDDDDETPPSPAAPETSLTGTPWSLTSGVDLQGNGAPSALFAKVEVDGVPRGRVSGFGGCNNYSGGYTLDGDELSMGDLATTQMACIGTAELVERDFMAAMGKVARWAVEDGELSLRDADDNELLRFGVPSIAGSWQATSFLQGDLETGQISSPIPGTEATAIFDDAGKLSGNAGCNGYSTTYETDGDQITIAPPAATRKACVEPAGLMEQEHAFVQALASAVRYELAGEKLTLLGTEGNIVATFIPS